MITEKVSSLEELPALAQKIIDFAVEERIFAFYGKMGAGKTTLINQILKRLGVEDLGSSPTFSLVNEYLRRNGEAVYHFDFYRIQTIEEVYDMGYEDYFFNGEYCLIEWPEKIDELLPEDVLMIEIEVEDGIRKVSVSRHN
ncbi:MAG: tRNA (adenosine(37)-N6)-threonylcarbamoyltransferase complex ATPase subunit type 1 TsaE [Flavobacteriales bacterium]|nr:tRNA (adenosine(37)-N6)-threonylcarbamoyltransferase complex ATPase subunit type 1 TsaE [Flavobacteriales bacterium]